MQLERCALQVVENVADDVARPAVDGLVGDALVAVGDAVAEGADVVFAVVHLDGVVGLLNRGEVQGFAITDITSQSTPFTVAILANSLGVPGTPDVLFDSDPGSGTQLLIQSAVDGSGTWRISVGANDIFGNIASSDPDLIVVTADGTNVVARINGSQVGTFAAAPTGSTPEIGGRGLEMWNGRFSFFMIADEVDPSGTKVIQTERYVRSRYP